MSLPELTAIDNDDDDDNNNDDEASDGNSVGHSPSQCAASIVDNSRANIVVGSRLIVVIVIAVIAFSSLNEPIRPVV